MARDLIWTQQPTGVLRDSIIRPTPVVEIHNGGALDSYLIDGEVAVSLEPIPNDKGELPDPPAALIGARTARAVGGVARFPDLSVDRAWKSGYRLVATCDESTLAYPGVDGTNARVLYSFAGANTAPEAGGRAPSFALGSNWTATKDGWRRTSNSAVGGELIVSNANGAARGHTILGLLYHPGTNASASSMIASLHAAGGFNNNDRLSLGITFNQFPQSRFRSMNGNRSTQPETPLPAGWHLIAAHADAGTGRRCLWLNGVRVAELLSDPGFLPSSADLELGLGWQAREGTIIKQVAIFETAEAANSDVWHLLQARRCGVAA